MNTQDNITVARTAYENFKNGAIEALVAQCADTVEWTLPEIEGVPFSGTRNGRDGVAEFFATLGANNENLAFEPRAFVADGDLVVALGTYTWRARPTGREYGGEWAHVFTVRDGKIAGFREYMDTAACANAFRKAASA